MLQRLLLLLAGLLFCGAAFAQTSLAGKVSDDETGEPILFCNIVLFKDGVQKQGTQTDFDGNYSFSNIDPGTYDVEVSYTGYTTARTTGVIVNAGKSVSLDFKMTSGITLGEVIVKGYKVPLIEQDNTTQGKTITSEDIKNLPTRNINALAATSAGIASADEGDAINIRGSRSNQTDYYIDGIRVSGSDALIQESEIDQLQVITGGIEAQYGDVQGGIISITTKGPSSKFSGGVEVESSQFTDAFNNNLVGFNMSGPILKNKSKDQSILGFRLSGRYTYNEDDDPTAVAVYQVKDDVLANLEGNPVIELGGNRFVAADFLTNDDVNALDAQPNEEFERINLNAKLDAQLSSAIDVTLSGTYNDRTDRFTPNEGSRSRANWRLMNSHNNPYDDNTTLRGNFRFRHRLGGSGLSIDTSNAAGRKSALIQKASYILQVGYENNVRDIYDSRHNDDYFAYGHIGNFDIEWVPTFNETFDPELQALVAAHSDYLPVLRGYTPGANNPVLANYNNVLELTEGEGINAQVGPYILSSQAAQAGTLLSRGNFLVPNGMYSSVFQSSWNFHNNVGTVYNYTGERDNDLYTFSASAAFDLVPRSSDNGRHNIRLGIWYEQRINRGYDVFPRDLWDAARLAANDHIQGIAEGAEAVGSINTAEYGDLDLLELTIVEDADNLFYRRIREELGLPLNAFVNVDGLDPSQLSLDQFGARELTDRGLVDYYGYDYLGNEFDGTFDDFFTSTNADGVRDFPVAPFQPIYAAAYIQDKFTFKDIIFRLGVRVDRYDANTKVLKDPYSLYEIMGAGEYHNKFGGEAPGNIGDDYKVYLDEGGNNVVAYRDGDQFYFDSGTPANNANLVFPGGLVFPKYRDPNADEVNNYIKSRDFDVNASFEDYEVQLNVMPRLAFSFPISEEANFFAHYDILVQRPSSNSLMTPLDYFYFTDGTYDFGGPKNNANLRPERTIDYEVGFQQKLSNTSALKISAYYKEIRDNIQQRTFFPVPILQQYTTYDNQDFGTIKGFSFAYDLRRTKNVTVQANYTLQFADGTGSDANSQRGLTSRGNLRTLFPLNYDERHRIVTTIDYRFGNKDVPTPLVKQLGVNLQAIAVSGRPYTAALIADQLGSQGTQGAINGARRPWNFTLNMRIDKTFKLSSGLGMNVYCRISNLLDQRNIINVYRATGSPEDDGFLASSNGRDQLELIQGTQRDVNSYLASYQWRILNPNFFSLPRRIFLGATLNF